MGFFGFWSDRKPQGGMKKHAVAFRKKEKYNGKPICEEKS
jgi:hypothetical protein